MDKVENLEKYKVRTISIKVPEIVYAKLFKYKILYRLDEIVINHLIDIIGEHEANGSQERAYKSHYDNDNVPELKGMRRY